MTIKNSIAVASGKGGVGKSTVAVNLALALAQSGHKVGLLDADIYGPSIGTMLGMKNQKPTVGKNNFIEPIQVLGIQAISMSMFGDSDKPVILRGPMITGILQQFLKQVDWGELDYLILDLPPGTGDIQLTLCQQATLSGAVMVSTPQDVATSTTMKGLRMFESLKVPILGLVENMSYFVAPDTGKEYDLFGKGKVSIMAQKFGFDFLGAVPIDPLIVEYADHGQSITQEKPKSLISEAFIKIAQNTIAALTKQQELKKPSFLPETITNIDPTTLGIQWVDGLKQKFPLRFLRASCTCASCKNEWSGEAQISEDQIKPGIAPEKIEHVGNYALSIKWNDGHSSGIYSYDYLRKIGKLVNW